MNVLNRFKKNGTSAKLEPPHTSSRISTLDDITFIRSMKHSFADPWHQYDVLLEARIYGWDTMLDWADYMADADLENISQVTFGSLGMPEKNITESYRSSNGKCKQTPELAYESGTLSIAGFSKTIKAPIKIVWFNQSRTLRLFTSINDALLMTQYTETAVRRTFGTPDAMKSAKPIPSESEQSFADKEQQKKTNRENILLSIITIIGFLSLLALLPIRNPVYALILLCIGIVCMTIVAVRLYQSDPPPKLKLVPKQDRQIQILERITTVCGVSFYLMLAIMKILVDFGISIPDWIAGIWIILFLCALISVFGTEHLKKKRIAEKNTSTIPSAKKQEKTASPPPSIETPAPVKASAPVKCIGNNIHINSKSFFEWKANNPQTPQYEYLSCIPLKGKEPTLCLYEDGIKTREYCLQTENEEDFSGKYFFISVRLGIQGTPPVPVAQIDGFISDTPEERKMTVKDIGYRMEGHFLACGGAAANKCQEMVRGQDLVAKGLKYPGYTTPSNIRSIGICDQCKKSFAFHTYAFYLMQMDVAYSDDGLDCCAIETHNLDKNTWKYEENGITFRYYNPFSCPHCGAPYIDYKKHPEIKNFGVSGCVHLGRKRYTESRP